MSKFSKRDLKNSPVWRETPACAAQVELEKMFENNLIGRNDPPNQVRLRNPLFLEFSPAVFAAHFRKTKAKLGLFAKSSQNDFGQIPELGEASTSSPITKNFDYIDAEKCEESDSISFSNSPYVAWTYTDHEQKCNFVNVALPIFSGSDDVKFTVSDDGCSVTINYIWPTAIFQPKTLYHREIYNKDPKIKIAPDHPKIHSLSNHLLQQNISELSFPKGSITIGLPVPVVLDAKGWVKKPMRLDDENETRVILLEMKAAQDKTIVKDTDTSLVFK